MLKTLLWGGDVLAKLEKSIEIEAPPEKVWEMLAFDKYIEWDEGTQKNAKSVEYTSDVSTPEDKYKVGASAHLVTKDAEELDFEITESLENEKITCRGSQKVRGFGNITVILAYSLKPTEVGTEMTFLDDYEMSSILGKILDKLFAQRMGEKQAEKSLEKLKSILEK